MCIFRKANLSTKTMFVIIEIGEKKTEQQSVAEWREREKNKMNEYLNKTQDNKYKNDCVNFLLSIVNSLEYFRRLKRRTKFDC